MNMPEFYGDNGYVSGVFEQNNSIHSLAELCLAEVKNNISSDAELFNYHEFVGEDEHRQFHYELTQKVRASKLHETLVRDNLSLFQGVAGIDLDIQAEPYLRITRPGIEGDNIGLHRDTMYGNSAYEVSCVVPIDDFRQGAAVSVLRDSQSVGPLDFEQVPHETITKGSKQNQIGFLYSTKVIKGLDREKLFSPLLKRGEFLMFSLGMVHGQEINSSKATRWSIDFRFKNSLRLPCNNLKKGYYKQFIVSPAESIGRVYYAANPSEYENV